ncbi:unnamed protein product [Clonostachys rosea]|uniref:Uncharacterized protein n=1 Tax=Bionectria ochroleuca TaxID=29856 RepID=A0ABY6UJC6_BIOOC|nr:unnamed protein product [Clonostachys rosea]
MASAKSNDTVMGGTAESIIDRFRRQLRSDIRARLKGQMPVEWPGVFYETPFLYFFADFFRKVCSLRLKDRVVVIEALKPTFSEMENALRTTARSLSHQRHGQDPVKTIRNLRGAVKCWEKLDDMNLTLEAIKTGKADKQLAEHVRETGARLAREAAVKTENRAAFHNEQDVHEAKREALAKQPDSQAPQPGLRKQEVQQTQQRQKEQPQSNYQQRSRAASET